MPFGSIINLFCTPLYFNNFVITNVSAFFFIVIILLIFFYMPKPMEIIFQQTEKEIFISSKFIIK